MREIKALIAIATPRKSLLPELRPTEMSTFSDPLSEMTSIPPTFLAGRMTF
jgi:hypothetical protein